MRVMAELGTPRSLTSRSVMVWTLSSLSAMFAGSLATGLPSALSGPSYDVHPSSVKVAWAARAAVTHGVRSRMVFAASISLAVLKTKQLSVTVHVTPFGPGTGGIGVVRSPGSGRVG